MFKNIAFLIKVMICSDKKKKNCNFLNYFITELCVSADCPISIHEECIFENGAYGICTCKNGQKVKDDQLTCLGKFFALL